LEKREDTTYFTEYGVLKNEKEEGCHSEKGVYTCTYELEGQDRLGLASGAGLGQG
jgi:hypothetical protein